MPSSPSAQSEASSRHLRPAAALILPRRSQRAEKSGSTLRLLALPAGRCPVDSVFVSALPPRGHEQAGVCSLLRAETYCGSVCTGDPQ
jgi:hypothetical protein